MPTVTRNEFLQTFRHGVDLGSSALQGTLSPDLLQRLRGLDRSGDGVLRGSEVEAAFRMVDGHDRNGSAHSFVNQGTAGQIFEAMKLGRREGPYFGQPIAKAALDRAAKDASGYAYANAPTSPYRNLSGNRNPGTSRPSWLQNQNKCNQFVGDALTQAGMKMPTFRMTDGTEHYVNAERLPQYTNHFDRVRDAADIRPGDVVVVDYPARGESTAHTEVVTASDPARGVLRTTGAHSDGAYEKDWANLLEGASFNRSGGYWEKGGDKIYVLRPKMPDASATRPIRG